MGKKKQNEVQAKQLRQTQKEQNINTNSRTKDANIYIHKHCTYSDCVSKTV